MTLSSHMLAAVMVACFAWAEPPAPTTAPATQPISIEAHFSAQEDIAPTVVEQIDGAQRSLRIAAFTFSHPDITAAIIRAHRRGVDVGFVMDYTQSRLKSCRARELIAAGIEVRTRHRRGFQHNKYIVIDESVLLSGSFNFTESADIRNTDNLLVIRNAPELVAEFLQDYERLRADSIRKRE